MPRARPVLNNLAPFGHSAHNAIDEAGSPNSVLQARSYPIVRPPREDPVTRSQSTHRRSQTPLQTPPPLVRPRLPENIEYILIHFRCVVVLQEFSLELQACLHHLGDIRWLYANRLAKGRRGERGKNVQTVTAAQPARPPQRNASPRDTCGSGVRRAGGGRLVARFDMISG